MREMIFGIKMAAREIHDDASIMVEGPNSGILQRRNETKMYVYVETLFLY